MPAAVDALRYRGLLFSYANTFREITNARAAVSEFITRESREVLKTWEDALLSFFGDTRDTGEQPWEIALDNPVRTLDSFKEFDRASHHRIFAEISSVWTIAHHFESGGKKRRPSKRHFWLRQKASTTVVLHERVNDEISDIASWTVDVASHDSPGTHFHTQVKGDGDAYYPAWLCVPRFPTMLVTVTDVLEFVIAELFQERWKARANTEDDYIRAWASEQQKRLLGFLDWQRSKVNATGGSMWSRLKGQVPDAHLFRGHP